MSAAIEKPQRDPLQADRYVGMSAEDSVLFDQAAAGSVPQDQANYQVCTLLLKLADASRREATMRAYVAGKYGETVSA